MPLICSALITASSIEEILFIGEAFLRKTAEVIVLLLGRLLIVLMERAVAVQRRRLMKMGQGVHSEKLR
jgi:hypothetical protein